MKKSELKELILECKQELAEESKNNVGIDSSMLTAVIKGLTKVKEDKINLRERLTPAQFDDVNKALNKIYSLLEK